MFYDACMKIYIFAQGKLKANTPEAQLINFYAKQCAHPIIIREFEEKRALPPAQLKQAESQMMLDALPPDSYVVALDERGVSMSSVQLADKLQKCSQTASNLVFCIGGAFGHDDILRRRANLVLSFGQMTLPHFLLRVVLVEQIYRAQTLWAHHPYHKE